MTKWSIRYKIFNHVNALNTWGKTWVEFSDLIILFLVNLTVGWRVSMSDSDKEAKGSEAGLIWHHRTVKDS